MALPRFGDQMPKGLYARALIIIIAPMVLLQSVLTFVFLERHWQTVTHRLSTGTVQNIAMLIDMYEELPKKHDVNRLTELAGEESRLARAASHPAKTCRKSAPSRSSICSTRRCPTSWSGGSGARSGSTRSAAPTSSTSGSSSTTR